MDRGAPSNIGPFGARASFRRRITNLIAIGGCAGCRHVTGTSAGCAGGCGICAGRGGAQGIVRAVDPCQHAAFPASETQAGLPSQQQVSPGAQQDGDWKPPASSPGSSTTNRPA